ncbi:MAG: GIY-YIG nuclease family protein, partial [Alphaproteobacteria bacterium]|nr:GIY-YIG nuclease family protein [Alphaproteobacteria bacterium]
MQFNDLLRLSNIDPAEVLVMRHRPTEPSLREQFFRIAMNEPHLFRAYQSSHFERAEKQLAQAQYLASFVGQSPGKATFIALSRNASSRSINLEEYWSIPENKELRAYGMKGFDGIRPSVLWFDLADTEFYPEWRGRLIVNWGEGGERSWSRWAIDNTFNIEAIRETIYVEEPVPDWREVMVRWNELKSLWPTWRAALSQWRGIYHILDESDGKGYVGSAYGTDNIVGRWTTYADGTGDGGNKKLRGRDPAKFVFSIL